MSKHLERDVDSLKQALLSTAALVEDAVRKAVQALHERRSDLAVRVIEGDRRIDALEVGVEEECLKILALHQPVAEDLRFVAAVLKINNDLERMADLAVNIAERAEFLADKPPLPVPDRLRAMTDAAIRMMHDSLDAFVNRDTEAARRIVAADEGVDRANREVIGDLLGMMREDPGSVERAMHLFSASRHLERIADHATNIAEDVVYMVEGEIIRHHHAASS